jgi:hypothetical protein
MKTRFVINLGICVLAALAARSYVPSAWAQAPRYEAEPGWPKPDPDHWVLGGLGGVCVDAQDHVLRTSWRAS